MTLTVREMAGSEIEIVVEYFLRSTPEHLEILDVDPTRLPAPERLRERLGTSGHSLSNNEHGSSSSGY